MSPEIDLWGEETVRIVQAAVRWADIARKERYGADWSPSAADVHKSCLLYRLLSGKEPLPLPPPTMMSDPWYELIENGAAYFVPEIFSEVSPYGDDHLNIAGDPKWRVLECHGDEYVLEHDGAPGTWDLRRLSADEERPKVGTSIASGKPEALLATWTLKRREP